MKKELDPHKHQKMLALASHDDKQHEERRHRPDKLNLIIYGLLIGMVLLLGAVYIKEKISPPPVYYYSNGDSEFEVRRVSETESQIVFYYANRQEPYVIDIRYGPIDLEGIEVEDKTIKTSITNDETVFITFDPKEGLKGEAVLAGVEVGKVIGNKYFLNVPVKSTVTSEYQNNTVMTCEMADPLHTVIWIKRGPETKITSSGSCITIEGPTESEMVKAADRLALYLVGIMP